jgi:hypothetical protein
MGELANWARRDHFGPLAHADPTRPRRFSLSHWCAGSSWQWPLHRLARPRRKSLAYGPHAPYRWCVAQWCLFQPWGAETAPLGTPPPPWSRTSARDNGGHTMGEVVLEHGGIKTDAGAALPLFSPSRDPHITSAPQSIAWMVIPCCPYCSCTMVWSPANRRWCISGVIIPRTLGAVGIARCTPYVVADQPKQRTTTSTVILRVSLTSMNSPRFRIISTPRDFGIAFYETEWDSPTWLPLRAGDYRAQSSAR